MRTESAVEAILGTRARVRVLRVLHAVSVPLNASQIAVRSGLSQPAVAQALTDLAQWGVVESSPAGRAWVHWLVPDNVWVVHLVVPAFEAEEHLVDAMVADLGEAFADDADSVVLFGSYARGDSTASSDVDVVLVARDAPAKERLAETASVQASGFRRRYGATLSPIVYDAAEARSMWRRAPELLDALESEGIVVMGDAPSDWRDDGA